MWLRIIGERVMNKITQIKEEAINEINIEDVLKYVTSFLNQQVDPEVFYQFDFILAVYELNQLSTIDADKAFAGGTMEKELAEFFINLMESLKFDKIRFSDLSKTGRIQYIRTIKESLSSVN